MGQEMEDCISRILFGLRAKENANSYTFVGQISPSDSDLQPFKNIYCGAAFFLLNISQYNTIPIISINYLSTAGFIA